MFKVGIFKKRKQKDDKLVEWLPGRYKTFEEADHATILKNKDLGADLDHLSPGQRFAMFDSY